MKEITVSIKVDDLATLVREKDLAQYSEKWNKDKIKQLETEIENLKKQLEQKENEK